jgi:hypothetical protein
MRLVLDTNIVISALLWGGRPGELILARRESSIELCSSIPLIEELETVLSSEKLAPRLSATGLSAIQVVSTYMRDVTLVRPAPVGRVAPDPDDDVVIGTAVAAKAELLVTGDKGLRSVRQYPGGRIVTVSEALAEIETA